MVAWLGAPRVVVNNAGIVRRGAKVHETAPAAWDEVMAVNLRGPFLISRAFLPAMLQAGARPPRPRRRASPRPSRPPATPRTRRPSGASSASPKSLAEELRGTGLQSIAVLPGSVDTDMLVGERVRPQMSADEVARLIVYAALDAPDAVTGSAIEMFRLDVRDVVLAFAGRAPV